uniref:Uncharacterized protein n=1 Tax=Alexandrium catenella TaxID=2925 RepID=A0A7S1SAK1_ALECA
MTFQAADIVDVDEPVTRPASLLSPNGIEEEPLTPDAVDSRDLEEHVRYWDFELGEDDGALEEGAGGLRGCRKVPLQEIVAEARSAEPRKMEPLRDIGNQPRPGPAWRDRRPPPRGKSVDGALFLEDLAGVSERPRGAASAELLARRGRVRRSKTIAT